MDILKRTWAEIDLDVLAENYKKVRACTNKDAKLCCVIKADAYGHGAEKVGLELEKLGADCFGVSNLEEALHLRDVGIKTPILIMGYTPAKEAKRLAENKISQCVYSSEYAKKLSDYAVKNDVNVNVHIKIDTGMNRLGFVFEDIDADTAVLDEIVKVCKLPNLKTEGIFTHFAVSDEGEGGLSFTMNQFGCFKELIEALGREDVFFEIKHCANSGGVLDYPLIHMDMVRAGIICYGLYPSGDIKNKIGIKPALSLKSVISHVKQIKAGMSVSYGRIFTAETDMTIATVPIGYADGYPRILGEKGADVLVRGKRCKIIGRICMDQLMIDVTDMQDLKIGEIVTLIGRDGKEEITAEEIARYQESVNYEVVCDIGKRVPRVYLRNGKKESISFNTADIVDA